jgi:hypothetical protein
MTFDLNYLFGSIFDINKMSTESKHDSDSNRSDNINLLRLPKNNSFRGIRASDAMRMVSDLDVEHSIGDDSKVWTIDMCKYLAILSYECIKMAWLHDTDAKQFNTQDKYLTAISSLASVISSLTVTSIMSFFDDDEPMFYIMTGLTIFLNLLVTLVNTWRYIFNYTLRVIEHCDKANKYMSLHRRVTGQFVLPLEQRYSAKTLMEYTKERIAELEREQPFNTPTTSKRWDLKRINFIDDIFTMPEELRGEYNGKLKDLFSKRHSSINP